MEKFNALMSRKIAGVPVIAIVALFAGIVLFYAIRMKPVATPEVVEGDESGYAGSEGDGGDHLDSQQPVFQTKPTVFQTSGVGGTQSGVTALPQEDNNELWRARVVAALQASGYSYNIAVGSVDKFLKGEPLSPEEAKARDKAIANFGMPPDGVEFAADVPVTTTPIVPDAPVAVAPEIPATVAPPPPKPAVRQGVPPVNHTIMGPQDNTPAELALLYYGHTTPNSVQRIAAANMPVQSPYPITGQVHVPKDKDPKFYVATAQTRTLHEIAKKNGTTPAALLVMNPKDGFFPAKIGTKVQVA